MFGLAGASLFYGDSMITPAISVLSAVEGLEVAISALGGPELPLGWCPAETAGVAQPLS